MLLPVMVMPAHADNINPNTYDRLTAIEENVREQMKLKSQMPETMENAADYWCLNDYLFEILENKYTEGYREYPPVEKLQRSADMINQNYTTLDNFTNFEPQFTSSMDAQVLKQFLFILMDGQNPLKMKLAEELIEDHHAVFFRVVKLDTSFFANSCEDSLEKQLGINVMHNVEPNFQVWMNVRGDLVSVSPNSAVELSERNYLVMHYSMFHFYL